MEPIQFRTITPIFNFSFDDETFIYNKNGFYRGIKYLITIKKYDRGEKAYNNILGGIADEFAYNNLNSIHMFQGYKVTDYFVTCDLFYEDSSSVGESQNTIETNNLVSALLSALNIVSTYGINSKKTYILRKPYLSAHYTNLNIKVGSTIYGNCVIIEPLSSPFFLNELALQKSTFEKEDFNLLNTVIDFFLVDLVETQFTRIFRLANDYFRLAFTVERKEHSYLFLILVCETLFRNETVDSPFVSSKISKLLAQDKESYKRINKEFKPKKNNSFYDIRNDIAHGNLINNDKLLKDQLLALFKYTRLLLINSITVIYPKINQEDYFTDLYRLIDELYKNKVSK